MNWLRNSMTPALALLIVACGGGGNQVAGIDAGGTPRAAVVAKGTLTGFGSVIVNGVRYDTDAASFTVDGGVGTQSDLRIGQIIIVKGSLDDNGTTGEADTVTYEDNVEGPVQAINLAGNSLIVLGQTVLTDLDTAFDDSISPASLAGLAINDIVEVSGLVRADGSITATRIQRKPAGGEFEVVGILGNLNAGDQTFQINDLLVDYSSAQIEDFPNGAPENGDLVEAKGTMLGAGGELVATRVEFKGDDIPGDDGDEAELEGFITAFTDSSDFDVEGRAVTTGGQTEYEGGTANDLALNVKVEVEGQINSNGVIVADKIQFKRAGDVRVEALVEDIQAGQNTLTLLGITVNVSGETQLEDKSDLDVNPLSLTDVNVNDFVAVRGFVDNGELTATRLERDDDGGEVALRALVEAVNDPQFTLFGVTVQTSAGTDFEDVDDSVLDSGQFFGQALGRLVDVEGTWNGTVIQAEEVELED
jgi:hypothetical protein